MNHYRNQPKGKTVSKQQATATEAATETTPFKDLYDRFRAIAAHQFSVNAKMAGADWMAQAKTRERIDYAWATLDETAELWRCSIPFKFWDLTEFTMDSENARMEVVDLLHFALSQELVNRHVDDPQDEDLFAAVAEAMLSGYRRLTRADKESPLGYMALKQSLLGFIHAATNPRGMEVEWSCLFEMAEYFGGLDKVLCLYQAKAALNLFRTEMRAANGTYSKIWLNDKEDNYYLTSWINDLPYTPSQEEILTWLRNAHRNLIKS